MPQVARISIARLGNAKLRIAISRLAALRSQAQITGADANVLATAILTLGVAACVAGLIPARRAASIEPQAAVRHD